MRTLMQARVLIGPLVTAVMAASVYLIDRTFGPMPAPGAIITVAVLFAAYHGGVASALISLAIASGFVAVQLSRPEALFTYDPEILARAWVFFTVVPGLAIVVALLRAQTRANLDVERKNREWAEAENRELESLRAAIDQINLGVLLLDKDMRARFMSRAMIRFGNLPENVADSAPYLRDLLRLGCDTGVFPVPRHKREKFIEARIAQVQGGDPIPRELRLGNGDIARMQCAVLPDGGRLLTYTLVTDLVRQAEELQNLRVALDQADDGIVLLDRDLRVEFMNREVRLRGKLTEPPPGEKPLFGDVLRRVAENGVYSQPNPDIEQHVAQRLAWVRSEDAAPYDFVRSDGRITRVKNLKLRDGAHLLIYSDETDAVRHVDELEELASIDGLTGLYNRRHFLGLADIAWDTYRAGRQPLSMLMFDIDRFKAVNDRFGHDAGDRVLARVADVCREEKRGADIAVRLGGEEFALLLPETHLDDALIFAERLRAAVAERTGSNDVPAVTISVGVAGATNATADFEELLKLTDRALYAAKNAGRNKVIIASEWNNEHSAAKNVA